MLFLNTDPAVIYRLLLLCCEELTSNTTDLRNSNQAISDSVQTISAVSEELTAHASETMDAETVNTQILENIAAKMKSLIQYIQKQ